MLKRLQKLIITIIIKSIGMWCITMLGIYLGIRLMYFTNRGKGYNPVMQLLDQLHVSSAFRVLLPFMYLGVLGGIIIIFIGVLCYIEKSQENAQGKNL